MTDQIDTFKSDSTVNKLGRYKIIIDSKTLIIRGYEIINVSLLNSNLRLYNALFISCLDINLLSTS